MKFRSLLPAALAGVLVIAAAGADRALAQGVSDDEVVFGMHTDLSGPAAAWGVGSRNGIRMRFAEANAEGGVHGRELTLVVEDHQYQVPKAVQAANKLINRDRIFAMLAALGTPMNNAVEPRLFQNNIANLFPYTSARSTVVPHHPLKFAAGATYYDHARIGTRYAVEELGAEKICVMAQETDFGEEAIEGATAQLAEMGMALTAAERHKPTDTDFVVAISRLQNEGCEALILGTIIKDTIIINATARKMGWEIPIIGNVASHDRVVSTMDGGVTEGYYCVTGFNMVYDETAEGDAKAWLQRYKERFGEEPSGSAQMGYMYGDLVVTALENAGRDLSTESLVAGIEAISGYRDIFGSPELSFGPDKHFGTTEAVVAQVQDGRWVALGEFDY